MTIKLGETRESVRGILVRLSPENGEKLKHFDALVEALEAAQKWCPPEMYDGTGKKILAALRLAREVGHDTRETRKE